MDQGEHVNDAPPLDLYVWDRGVPKGPYRLEAEAGHGTESGNVRET